MAENDDIGTADAHALLILDGTEFKALAKAARIKPVAPDRWRVVDIVHARIRSLIEAATYYSTPRMAEAFGISHQRVAQLNAEGVLQYAGKNKYHRDDTTRAYTGWQRQQTTSKHRSTSESRVREARATEIEIRTAERSRHLIAIDEALESNAAVCGYVRTEFGGLAARITRDLALRRDIEKAVNDSFARIAGRLAEEARNLETGRAPVDAVADDAAGRMGEGEPKLPAIGGPTGSA
jgi:hypothetical protein